MGGLVAFEMALQLSASGEKVALVALFDSYFPRVGVAFTPIRFSEFLDEFAREHLSADVARRGVSRRSLSLRRAFEQFKRAGLIPQTFGPRDFKRFLVKHWHSYRLLLRIGRRYMPSAPLEELVLFEAEDQSMSADRLSANWNTLASRVTRHIVPGNHYTIVREPNVRALAECLGQYLVAETPGIQRRAFLADRSVLAAP